MSQFETPVTIVMGRFGLDGIDVHSIGNIGFPVSSLGLTRVSSVLSLRLESREVKARPRTFLRSGVEWLCFLQGLMAGKSKGFFSFINMASHLVFFEEVVIPILNGFRRRLVTHDDSIQVRSDGMLEMILQRGIIVPSL